jgi:hypothetical protein
VTEPAAVIATSVRPCPQCAGTTVLPIHEGRFVLPEGHPLEPVVRVVACGVCGFCFNDTAFDRFPVCLPALMSEMRNRPLVASCAIVAPAEVHRHISADTPIAIGSLVNLESIEASMRDLGLANPVIRLAAVQAA